MEEDLSGLHPAIRALKTICRCNNVKYKTLEKAIQGGASTIREIASKTTATTGYCGGTCTPDVLNMIESLRCASVPAAPAADEVDEWWARPMVKNNG